MEKTSLEKDADSGKLKEVSKDEVPVVLMFQPTKFYQVPPERLKEWEQLLKERVGLPKLMKIDENALVSNGGGHVTCSPHCDDCG